jgi:Cell wall-associated hydrolases (invasion-associated proteins)
MIDLFNKIRSKIKITKKLIVIVSVAAALLVAGGTVSAVSYTQHNEQMALNRQMNYDAAMSTASVIAFSFDNAADAAVLSAEKRWFEESEAREAKSRATKEAAAEAAANEAAEKEAQKKAASSQSIGGNEGSGEYEGIALAASKYIGNNDMSCTELVWSALADMGYAHTIARTTRTADGAVKEIPYLDYKSLCSEVSLDQIQMGDILVSAGHVEIYVGNGKSIHGGYGLPGTGYTNVVVAKTTNGITKAYRLD